MISRLKRARFIRGYITANTDIPIWEVVSKFALEVRMVRLLGEGTAVFFIVVRGGTLVASMVLPFTKIIPDLKIGKWNWSITPWTQ